MTTLRTRIRSFRARSHEESGMTLIELVIGVVVMGFVGTAVTAALFMVLRSDNATRDRLETARVGDKLAAWFASDVASATPGTAIGTAATDSSGCTTGATGTNIVRFIQTGFQPGATVVSTQYVSYRNNAGKLFRYVCNTATGTLVSSEKIANLAADPSPPAQPLLKAEASAPTATTRTTVTLRLSAIADAGTVSTYSVTASTRRAVS